jgi:hypothetical protein
MLYEQKRAIKIKIKKKEAAAAAPPGGGLKKLGALGKPKAPPQPVRKVSSDEEEK